MDGSGVLKHAPVSGGQTAVIAYHQCREGAGAALSINRQQALSQLVTPCQLSFSHRHALSGFNRAAGTDPSSEEPGLVIKRVRIDQASRPFQFGSQPPSLPCLHPGATVPRKAKTGRKAAVPGRYVDQLKAHHTTANIRQTAYHAFQPERSAIKRDRKAVVQSVLGAETGPRKPAEKAADRSPAERQ